MAFVDNSYELTGIKAISCQFAAGEAGFASNQRKYWSFVAKKCVLAASKSGRALPGAKIGNGDTRSSQVAAAEIRDIARSSCLVQGSE